MSKRLSITLSDETFEALNNLEYIADDGVKREYSASQKIEKAIKLLIIEQNTMRTQFANDAMQWNDPMEKAMYDADIEIYKMMEERRHELGKD